MTDYKDGLVSIVTPTYNGETFIGRYLDSILAQTYKHLQLILVDDGSSDETVAVAETYKDAFSEQNIDYTVYRAQHTSASGAINYGLPLVKGEFLIWPDSDDILEPTSIEVRVDFLTNHPEYSCVRTLPYYFNESGEKSQHFDEKLGDLDKEDLFFDILWFRTYVACGCYMLRTKDFFDIYKDKKIPEAWTGQNFQMLLPMLYKHRCKTIKEPLYGICQREGSHSRLPLTYEEELDKYATYRRLLDDIARVTPITNKDHLHEIEVWKVERDFGLELRHNHLKNILTRMNDAKQDGYKISEFLSWTAKKAREKIKR